MRSTLLLLLASLAALAAAAEGRGEANTVKLCGRDFVRAVVFTCGGSRWKRHLTDYHYLFVTIISSPMNSCAEAHRPLPLSQGSKGHADGSTPAAQRLETEDRELRPEMESRSPALGKREAAKLLTTSCCSMGCSEREISSLC